MNAILRFLQGLAKAFTGTVDRPSPSDIFVRGQQPMQYLFEYGAFYIDSYGRKRLKKEWLQIPFRDDPELWPCLVPGTKSMDPVFDKEHDNLYLKGATPIDQGVLIEWLAAQWLAPPQMEKPRANLIVALGHIHRLHKIEYDKDGSRLWWFRGDNNSGTDPVPARDSDIEYVMVMTAY